MFSNLRLPIVSVLVLAVAGCSAVGPTATPGSSAQPTAALSATASAGATPTATGSPSPTLAASPTATTTTEPTASPSPTATASPSPSPAPVAAPIELVAGAGAQAVSNGVTATDAKLIRASGVAVAPDGTIWIVDASLNLLFHIGADGKISDVAAGLYGPEGVAVGPDGHVYVADRGAYRVASPNGSGDTISFAGIEFRAGFTGDGGLAKKAKLWLPYDVATDGAGNLYISDTGNERIRMVDSETLKIQTIVGTGVDGFGGDGGPALNAQISDARALAVDSAATALLIADYGNSRLRRVDLATNVITTVAGSGTGAVNYSPALTALQTPLTHLLALAVDGSGNAYFPVFYADIGLTIMRLDATGAMTRVAGGGLSSNIGVSALDFALSEVIGLAIDPATGDLYICAAGGFVYRVPAAPVIAGP